MVLFVDGRGNDAFLQDICEHFLKKLNQPPKAQHFQIYRWSHCGGYWRRTSYEKARFMKSVILPEGLRIPTVVVTINTSVWPLPCVVTLPLVAKSGSSPPAEPVASPVPKIRATSKRDDRRSFSTFTHSLVDLSLSRSRCRYRPSLATKNFKNSVQSYASIFVKVSIFASLNSHQKNFREKQKEYLIHPLYFVLLPSKT